MQPPRLPYLCQCPRSGTQTCLDRPSTLSDTKFTVTDYYIILSFQDMGGTYRRHFSDTENAKEEGAIQKEKGTNHLHRPKDRWLQLLLLLFIVSDTQSSKNVAAVDICRCGQTRFQSFMLYSRAWAVHHGNPNLLYSPFFLTWAI